MKELQNRLRGTGAALVTPFRPGGAIDFEALGRLVDYVIAGGVDYVVALGTTAETPTLYLHERAAVASFVAERVASRVPIVTGIGGNSTSEVLDQLREIDLRASAAILSVTPYYNRPSQQGLFEHYRVVAEASPVPVILYNVPARTGVDMSAATTLRIAAELPNILGIKEACGRLERMEELLRARGEGFMVLSGDDALALPLARLGGDGVISVAAGVFPDPFCRAVRAALAGEEELARELYKPFEEVVPALFAEGNPAGAKAALAVMGMIEPVLRLPLVAASAQLEERMRMLVKRYNL